MVVRGASQARRARPPAAQAAEKVLWHDLECGSYRADLPLWRELAGRCAGPILDVGAGSGRVSLDLARAGHEVTALDLDNDLLRALSERAAGRRVDTACADARSFELARRDFALCIVPMQTIQLLDGSPNRIAFLRRVRAHTRRRALLACAILTAPEPFDCAQGDNGPSAESTHRDGLVYVSRATRVEVLERTVLIERERVVLPEARGGAARRPTGPRSLTGAGRRRRGALRDRIELDRVSASELAREAVEAGLRPCPAREVAATAEYVGSTVVMFRA